MRNTLGNPRYWDLPAGLVLIAALLISASRLIATEWTSNLSVVQSLAFFGAIAGLLIGTSRFSGSVARFFGIFYGVFAIPWQLGQTLPVEYTWNEKMMVLINRLKIIISQLLYHEAIRDSLLFLVFMYALYWAIAVRAGYILVRDGNAWKAVLPGGISMLIIHIFDPLIQNRIWYLAAYLFFSLVLISRMNFVIRCTRWRESRTAMPPHLSLDFIRYTILTAFLIVVFAWNIPAFAKAIPQASQAWQPVRSIWNRSIKHFENVFASLNATVATYTVQYSPITTLGRGTILTDTQMFRARALLTMPQEIRLYWQARVYDHYDHGQWRSSHIDVLQFSPISQDLAIEPGISRWLGSFTVTSATNISTLYTPSQPLWVSRNSKVEYSPNPDGSIEIITFSVSPLLNPGENYEILSAIGTPTIEELKHAGDNYPDWISERYLQLPSTLTDRTKSLAETITAGQTSPYEKTVAITTYLRKNIRYVETLDQIAPSGQDPIDWFLFDAKQGFCDYYASAEILMLRAIGIPARLAVGFAQGELVDNKDPGYSSKWMTYLIRQRDSHAWPQVYFPGFGWIEFEPTGSQPEIIRHNDNSSSDTSLSTEAEELAALREDKREQLRLLRERGNQVEPISKTAWRAGVFWRVSLVLLSIALLIYSLRFLPLFGFPTAPKILKKIFNKAGIPVPEPINYWADAPPGYHPIKLPSFPVLLMRLLSRMGMPVPKLIRQWARYSELPPLSKAYIEINRGLSLLGNAPKSTSTPTERGKAIGLLVPAVENEARNLVQEYQISVFANQPANVKIAQNSSKKIRKLVLGEVIHRFIKRLQKKRSREGQFDYRKQ